MLRRRDGDGWILVTQHEHARVSGALAKHLAPPSLHTPDRMDSLVTATTLHDSGWPLSDDLPERASDGGPPDVFLSTVEHSYPIWRRSADIAQEADPYAGLLVSLHVLWLSVPSTPSSPPTTSEDLRQIFLLNQFQQREIERQEILRAKCGLRTDIPLTRGLAEPGIDTREDELAFHLRWLQAMDIASLLVCRRELPFIPVRPVQSEPGEPTTNLRFDHEPGLLRAIPWPFDLLEFEITINARRLRNSTWETNDQLAAEYAAAQSITDRVKVRRS